MEENKIVLDFNNRIFKLNGVDIGSICTGAEIKITPGHFPEVTLHLKHSLAFTAGNCIIHDTNAETTDANDEINPATDETSSK